MIIVYLGVSEICGYSFSSVHKIVCFMAKANDKSEVLQNVLDYFWKEINRNCI